MIGAAEHPEDRSRADRRPTRGWAVALVAALAVLLVVLWGGYGHHWSWTGINGRTATLWDWLHLLLLPVAVGVLPIWLSRQNRLPARHKSLGFAVVAVFGVLVLAGYTVPWAWTGFVGNRLWDWLNLIALPLAVALMPVFRELRANWSRRHSLISLSGLLVFAAIVLGGYLANWRWTGFRGNTLWDWLHLLLLPLLLPTIVVPALKPMATAGLILQQEGQLPSSGPTPAPPGDAESASAPPSGIDESA